MKIQFLNDAGYEKILKATDPSGPFTSFIAIHNTHRGPALGGVRFWNYRTEQEALEDVLRLARSMTYKSAVAELPHGGGKGVIVKPPGNFDRRILMEKFGEFIETLGGLYITAKDVGTTAADMSLIHHRTRWVTGLPPEEGGAGNPSPLTAYGVLVGIKTTIEEAYHKNTLQGIRVVLQGLGGVGKDLAEFLIQEGAEVSASEIDSDRLQYLAKQLNLHPLAPEEIFSQEADVLAPCALGQILNHETISKLRVKMIAGSANDQLEDEKRDAEELNKRGILYAPDFVINAGGLIHVAMELEGYDAQKAKRKTEQIATTLKEVFSRAKKENLTTHEAALRLARSRL